MECSSLKGLDSQWILIDTSQCHKEKVIPLTAVKICRYSRLRRNVIHIQPGRTRVTCLNISILVVWLVRPVVVQINKVYLTIRTNCNILWRPQPFYSFSTAQGSKKGGSELLRSITTNGGTAPPRSPAELNTRFLKALHFQNSSTYECDKTMYGWKNFYYIKIITVRNLHKKKKITGKIDSNFDRSLSTSLSVISRWHPNNHLLWKSCWWCPKCVCQHLPAILDADVCLS